MYATLIVLASECVRRLMEKGENEEQQPKLAEITERLFCEGVVLERI